MRVIHELCNDLKKKSTSYMLISPFLILLIKIFFFILSIFFDTNLNEIFSTFKVMSGGMYVFCTENTIFDIPRDNIIVSEPISVRLLFYHVIRIDYIFFCYFIPVFFLLKFLL